MNKGPLSRRELLQGSAAAAVVSGASALIAQNGQTAAAASSPAILTGATAGRSYRAFARLGSTGGEIVTLRTLTLDPDRVVVRTEATQCCYSILGQVAMLPGGPRIAAQNPQSDPRVHRNSSGMAASESSKQSVPG